jgi:hypothetical protein
MKTLGRALIFVAILLALAIVPVLFLGASWPTYSVVSPLVCESGAFDSEMSQTRTEIGGSGIARVRGSISASCISVSGAREDVTGKFLIIAALAFIVPLIAGITFYGIGNVLVSGAEMADVRAIAEMPDVKQQTELWQQALRTGQMTMSEYTGRVKALYMQKSAELKATRTNTEL